MTDVSGLAGSERQQHQTNGHQSDRASQPARCRASSTRCEAMAETGNDMATSDLGQVEREQPDGHGVQQEADQVGRDDDHHPAVPQRAGDEPDEPVGCGFVAAYGVGLHHCRDAENHRGQQACREA